MSYCVCVCVGAAGDGASGRDPGRRHGGRVLPATPGRRPVCPSADLLHHGGNQQLGHIAGTHTHKDTRTQRLTRPPSEFPAAAIASCPIRQDAEADGRQMVDTSAAAKWLMYLDSGGALRRLRGRRRAPFGLDQLIETTAFKFCKQCLQDPQQVAHLAETRSRGSSVARQCNCSIIVQNEISSYFFNSYFHHIRSQNKYGNHNLKTNTICKLERQFYGCDYVIVSS